MENNATNKGGFFNFMYRTRIMVTKNNVTIINLSLLFSIISLLCAPWLVVGGVIVALVLGYKFAIDRNAPGFEQDFETMVKDAADNVKQAVTNVTNSATSTENKATDEAGSDDNEQA